MNRLSGFQALLLDRPEDESIAQPPREVGDDLAVPRLFPSLRLPSARSWRTPSDRADRRHLLSSAAAVQQTAAGVGEEITLAQGECVATAYATSGLSPYFALGVGVAGPNGVLAGHNPNDKVLADIKGIDHLEDSPIGAALFGALESCGLGE